MREAEIGRLLAANLLCAASVALTAVVPPFFWEGFSVLGTHLAWLCVCCGAVGSLHAVLHFALKPQLSPRRSSCAHKVRLSSPNCCQTGRRRSGFFHWINQMRKGERE